ncbi:MAG: protein kinase, partial [Oscillospiraceae bacterium]|nr:protein kinase [Oscillospiraceae bacterium]
MSNVLSFADEIRTEGFFALPPKLAGRFHVMACLAKKELDKTFLLEEKIGGKEYVLKCYRKENIASDSGEAALLRGLDHPGLPKYEEDYDDGATLFVLREYAAGLPLDAVAKNSGLNEEQTVGIAIKLCDTLAYLHKHLVIHRDVTPSNIIVDTRSGRVCLIDFGIARRYSKTAIKDTMYLGKEGFAPPEQHGYTQTDARSDIYSLGVVLRFLLAGSTDAPVPNRDLAKIVEKCTAYDQKSRFQTAEALNRALRRFLRRSKRKTLAVSALAVATSAALLLGLTAGYAVGRGVAAPPQSAAVNPNGAYSPNEAYNPDAVHTFTEPLIEQAARLMLNKPGTQPLTYGDLAQVTKLVIVGDKAVSDEQLIWQIDDTTIGTLTNLEDLTAFPRLRSLSIARQPALDLSAFAKCLQLDGLALVSCDVEDLSPLAEAPQLTRLDVNDLLIQDYSQFEALKSITMLAIHPENTIKSLSELGDVSHLAELVIKNRQFSSIEGIEHMTRLERLSLENSSVEDFSLLNGLPRLKTFTISPDMEQ